MELGYFIGKIGLEKIIIISENGLEYPSDIQGIAYTNKENWQEGIYKELKAIGYDIDVNTLYNK